MPIYLAQPGVSSKEPWRHGLQVYERPFPINLELDNNDNSSNNNDDDRQQQSSSNIGGVTTAAAGGDTNQQLRPTMRHDTTLSQSHSSLNNNEGPNHDTNINESTTSANSSTATLSSAVAGMTSQQIIDNNNNDTSAQATSNNYLPKPKPLRRIRHSEIVLVDQCLIAYGRYWLRLKWPGEQGGHGGYVALYENNNHQGMKEGGEGGEESSSPTAAALSGAGDDRNNNNNLAMGIVASSSPVTTTSIMCTQTNVPYPTSGVLKLLPSYDDGLNNENNDSSNNNNIGGDEILISLETGEPVFCRICREGLHDVNTDYLETTTPPSSTQQQQQSSSGVATNAVDDEADEGSPGPTLSGREGRRSSSGTGGGGRDVGVNAAETVTNTTTRNDISEETVGEKSSSLCPTTVSNELSGGNGAVTIPPITRFHPSAENPLLAPCLCTGSMAFVHYLCVEQWRCRSRHPGARNGLNCETCNAEYTLPPPPSRPNRGGIDGVGNNNNMMVDDDWLDAMPPHVLAALRRPHPWWQLGAAVVRRRWLRPIVPVLASPLVALYCKARRTLKKRGVSRRRWACSLCRRRARWKCVRCLRSYYCSRQCQNVSWHIVHKHVCYKPVRFWWSVVVYTLGTLILVPGIVKNFPIYDTSATLLPVNFVAMGNIAGGVASTLKRSSGIDIRGRILEISVILCTLFLTAVSSGVVRAYFGDSSQCWGVLASSLAESSAVGTPPGPFIDSASNKAFSAILQYAQLYYRKWDFLCARAGILSRFICTPTDDGNADFATIGCSSPVRSINPQFYLEEENCRADIGMVVGIWVAGCLVLFLEHLYRSYRVRRRLAVHLHRGRQRPHHQRPHQD